MGWVIAETDQTVLDGVAIGHAAQTIQHLGLTAGCIQFQRLSGPDAGRCGFGDQRVQRLKPDGRKHLSDFVVARPDVPANEIGLILQRAQGAFGFGCSHE